MLDDPAAVISKTASHLLRRSGLDATELDQARADTPGIANRIHLNNAGAALMPRPVIARMLRHIEEEAAIGGYEAAEAASQDLKQVRVAVGELIGAKEPDVALMESAFSAWSQAFYSVPLRPGDRVLASAMEYGSNFLSLQHVAARTGAIVEIIPNDESGRTDAKAFANLLDGRVKLVVMTHVPSNGGLVNPVAEIGRICRGAGVLYLLDACQSVGQMPVDVDEIGCDFMAACGRKYLRGPRGTGFLYARKEALEQVTPWVVGLDGAHWIGDGLYGLADGARVFETWENNCTSRLGLGAAVEYASAWGVQKTWPSVRSLAARLRQMLSQVRGVRLQDPPGDLCGIVTFTVEGLECRRIADALSAQGINVWTCLPNSACVDMQARGLDSLVRTSLHYYNDEADILTFCLRLEALVEQLSGRVLVGGFRQPDELALTPPAAAK